MKPLSRLASRLRGMIAGRRRDSELIEELESHIEMQTDDNIRAGMSPHEARRAARLKFGSVESVKESYRDQRGLPFVETLFADLQFALRQLRSAPVFTVTVIVTIALGIGANTAVFSVINAVLLKPLPISEPDRLVWLTTKANSEPDDSKGNPYASPAVFIHLRAQSVVLEDVSAFLRSAMNYKGGTGSELWKCLQVSGSIFRVFRMPMLHGRTFTPDEERANGARVVVLSRGLWQRQFEGDPNVVGKTITLNGEPYTVVGVAADSPGFLESAFEWTSTDAYIPFQVDSNTSDLGDVLFVVARLKPGITAQQAKERLRLATNEYRSKFPNNVGPDSSFSFMTIREAFNASDQRPAMALLMATVAGVLLIACTNVANLLLVRSVARRREIGIRIAVGAGRRRVIRQLLTESMLLSACGGAAGLVLGLNLLSWMISDLPPIWNLDLDWRVLAFTFAVSVSTALVFGLLPALQASRVDLNVALKDSGQPGAARQNRLRSLFVVCEVALAVVLLSGSALLIRSFIALTQVEPGFEARNVLLMHTSFSGAKYATADGVYEAIRSSLDRLRELPGVTAAASAGYAPLEGNLAWTFNIAGRPAANGVTEGTAGWTPVTPDYFDVFKIPMKRGRRFTERDNANAPPVALINETMARTFWKDRDPLNDRLVIPGEVEIEIFKGEQPRQIVGIVGDIRQSGLHSVPEPRIYVPQFQLPDATIAWMVRLAPNAWVVRTERDTQEGTATIQDQLQQATGLPVFETQSMLQVVKTSTEGDLEFTLIIGLFAGLAVLLAAVGIYGVMAYTVEQRRQEIGIRLALGADAFTVKKLMVRHGMKLAFAGVLIGLAATWELAQFMEGMLFGVQPRDPIVLVIVPLVLTAVALIAVWLPAARGSRVNPADSLRCE